MNVNKVFKTYENHSKSFDFTHRGGIKSYNFLLILFLIFSKLKFIFASIFKLPTIKIKNEIIEVIFSKNQLKCSNVLGINSYKLIFGIKSYKENEICINNLKLLQLSLIFSNEIYIVLKTIKSNSLLKKNTYRIIKLIVVEGIFKSLKHENLKSVLQYNDHSPYNVMTFDYFKSLNIKMIYCQHAPVGYHFPALYHDLNLLFSDDSHEKYEKISKSKKEVFIIGDIRFWSLNNFKKKKYVIQNSKKVVLICYNKLDCTKSA